MKLFKPSKILKFLFWRAKHLNERNFMLILSTFVGLAGGLVALILKTSVFYMRNFLVDDLHFDFTNYLLIIYPAIGITITFLIMVFLIKDDVKHSISSILYAISKRKSFLKQHKIFSSMFGGILTAGFGGSIGLEAPIISSGAAVGSNIGRILKMNYKNVTLLLACGSAGAMSAIFNTPITAVIFAFEVLLLDMSGFALIPLLIASVFGNLVTRMFYQDAILFDFNIIQKFQISELPVVFVFAILLGLISVYFTRMYLYIEHKMQKIKKNRYRLLIGFMMLGTLTFLFPPLFGEGFQTIKELLNGNENLIIEGSLFRIFGKNTIVVIIFFISLIFIKVIATSLTISSGGVGGVFAPALFTGAISGFVFSTIINSLNISIKLPVVNFIFIGMAGLVSGVIHAPLTAMFLIAEITGGYELIVPLMFAVTISFVTVKYLQPNSIFTEHLEKRGELITHNKDKAVLRFIKLSSVIEKDFSTINIDASFGDLVEVIKHSNRNIFPVIDKKNNFKGLITLDMIREIMFDKKLYKKMNIREIFVYPPRIIDINDNMEMVVDKFKTSNAWNLPVTDNGKYIGFISKSKLFNVYRQMLVDISVD